MSDESLLPFLKSYAAALQDDSMLSEYAPFSCHASMAGGHVQILDARGNCVGGISFTYSSNGDKLPYSPSCPITPMDVGFSKLAVDMVNAVLRERKQFPKATQEGA